MNERHYQRGMGLMWGLTGGAALILSILLNPWFILGAIFSLAACWSFRDEGIR